MTEYIYKTIGDRNLRLWVYEPTDKVYEKAPVCVFVPGGGWKVANGKGMVEFAGVAANLLRNAGCAVVGIEYRIVSEENVGINETVSDCFDAARYLVHNADNLGFDAGRMVTVGHSAGGHLALMMAYADDKSFKVDSVLCDEFSIKAAAVMSPVTALHTDSIPQTLGFPTNDPFRKNNTIEERKKLSPIEYVTKNTPPTFLSAATSDRLVYCNSSELLYEKLQEAGVDSELVLCLGGGHCFEKMHKEFETSIKFSEIQERLAKFVLERI